MCEDKIDMVEFKSVFLSTGVGGGSEMAVLGRTYFMDGPLPR